jgi:hypothetical protein
MYKSDGTHNPLNHSQTAPAIILKRWETNIVFNGSPQIGLLLEVHPSQQPVFKAEVKTVVARARLAQLQPGAMLTVSFNPASPARVFIASLPNTEAE